MQFMKALFLCIIKHWKQKDKAGKKYIFHPIIVMLNVKGYKEKIVALLHDIVEDTDITLEELKSMKFNNEIIKAIDAITKKKGQNYLDYLELVKENDIARKVKISDLKHNMNLKRLKNITMKDLERLKKYENALVLLSN